MRWRQSRRSQNIDDRRGRRAAPRAAAGLGIGGLLVALVILFMGGDPSQLLGSLTGSGDAGATGGGAVAPTSAMEEERAEFVAAVLGETEDVWHQLFQQIGKRYEEPTLVLYRDAVQSACGFQSAAAGPFYCPGDRQLYLDLAFFDELERSLGAPGDFAQAYVIAHEVGHHIQTLLGISEDVRGQKRLVGEAAANDLQVRMELQADFLAGVWAHHAHQARQVLEMGDIEEALNAASRIGDDYLQKNSRGYVTPDTFTHGTSAQRMRWFKKGLETGDLSQGDTFKVENP